MHCELSCRRLRRVDVATPVKKRSGRGQANQVNPRESVNEVVEVVDAGYGEAEVNVKEVRRVDQTIRARFARG